MSVFVRIQVGDILGVDFYDLSVSEKAWPDGRPVGMKYFFIGHICTLLWIWYSKMQSSYCNISFMHGVVSNVLGTDAGTFAK